MKTSSSPIPAGGEPALAAVIGGKKALILGDTHIGIEYELLDAGFRVPFGIDGMLRRLNILLQAHRPDTLIHLGDFKHSIPRAFEKEEDAVRAFVAAALQTCKKVEIVPGNHDGGLHRMLEDYIRDGRVGLHAEKSLSLGPYLFTHGHTWPGAENLKCKTLVLAHSHPAVRLCDRLGKPSTHPCWLRGKTNPGKVEQFYGKRSGFPNEFIIVPAFNTLRGSAVNGCRAIGPLARNGLLGLKNAEAFLLDGTALGELGKLPEARISRRGKATY